MIGATISAAQLDTVDVDELAAVAELSATIDRMEADAHRATGARFRLSLGVHGLIAAFVAIGEAAQKTGNTLELSVPAFEDVPMVPDFRQLANPRAPIPERIRRRFDRGRGRR